MSEQRPPTTSAGEPTSPLTRLRHAAARVDANPTVVSVIRSARGLLPNTPPLPAATRPSTRVAELIARARPEQPSASRELGLTAVGLWQSATSWRAANRLGQGASVAATIVFTDLVGFSTWALAAGDDQVIHLIHEVDAVCADIVSGHGGTVVKSLGDGLMAVFPDAEGAAVAAHEAVGAVSALTVGHHRPQLRAGMHTGTPRSVGDDYLGVDVNIAARVAAAAGAGEVLASDATLELLDEARYATRRRRRFRAKGVPRELTVYAIVPRYDS